MMISDPEMTVQELLQRFPNTMGFFLRQKMLCIGCPSAAFHTLEEVAFRHHMTAEFMLRRLNETITAADVED